MKTVEAHNADLIGRIDLPQYKPARTTLEFLQSQLSKYGSHTPEYYDKMMHEIPLTTVVDRDSFMVDRCKGKRILDLGSASGGLHELIKKTAVSIIGIDKNDPCDFHVDLDSLNRETALPNRDFDLIVIGETVEHLSNPGNLLKCLRQYPCPLLITTPNAFNESCFLQARQGMENVNKDHV